MLRLVSSLIGLGLLASTASAQISPCFAPDNLAGPCCSPVGVNLPPLPPISLPASAICWTGCGLTGQDCTTIDLSAPAPTAICGQFDVQIKVNDCAGNNQLFGKGRLDYARTWGENGAIQFTPSGPTFIADYQVWRFLLKMDLQRGSTTGTPPPCTVPADLALNPTVFYYGYVDYAIDCISGAFRNSVVLFHGCDWLINFPGISSGIGGANPNRTYALVAPNSVINPFVPAASLVFPNVLQNDSVRAVGNILQPTAPWPCNAEEDVSQGIYNPYGFGCLCPPSLGPIQTAVIQINGASFCGSSYQSINLFGTVPWIDNVSTSLGQWTSNSDYPGNEAVRADEGLYAYRDSCLAGTIGNGLALEVFYGAETQGGFPAFLPPNTAGIVTPVTNFVDLVSNWRRPAGTPLMLPAIGRVMNSYHVISLNP